MQEFSAEFSKMVNYGFLGIYRRLSIPEEDLQTRFVPALTKACGIGAYLNFKYNLKEAERRILPETEREMFKMFEMPLEEIINKLPQELINQIQEETDLYGIGALFESIDDGKGVLTEDGYEMRSNRAIYKSINCLEQMGEYDGQQIFEELCKGEYREKRVFLENPDNVYIPDNSIYQSDTQQKFIKSFPDLFERCYQPNRRLSIYRCKRCGMILREPRLGVFLCVSKKCNQFLDEKVEVEMHGAGRIMNDVTARNIFYPGQLERSIKEVLDVAIKKGTVDRYELWPGKYEGIYDTWDFKVYLKDGRIWLLDAKDVENPHWIIIDKREFLKNADFIYIVPNDKPKVYLEQINNNTRCLNEARCIRVKDLKKILEVKEKNA